MAALDDAAAAAAVVVSNKPQYHPYILCNCGKAARVRRVKEGPDKDREYLDCHAQAFTRKCGYCVYLTQAPVAAHDPNQCMCCRSQARKEQQLVGQLQATENTLRNLKRALEERIDSDAKRHRKEMGQQRDQYELQLKQLQTQAARAKEEQTEAQQALLQLSADYLRTSQEAASSAAAAGADVAPKGLQCTICMDATADQLILPCRHVYACLACSTKEKICAMCKEPISVRFKIFPC